MPENNDSVQCAQELIQHRSLRVLMPYLRDYLRNGLAQLRSEGKAFRSSPEGIYAAGVVGRVSELDNSLTALRLSSRFVNELADQPTRDLNVYRYHYENFLLRVIGFDDRAHRLVGAALLMNKSKFEGTGGNKFVQKQVEANDPEIHGALQAVTETVDLRGILTHDLH